MVVQANVAGQADQTKVGDLVYQGDVVKTGADGRIGINFADGSSFNLSQHADTLWAFKIGGTVPPLSAPTEPPTRQPAAAANPMAHV